MKVLSERFPRCLLCTGLVQSLRRG